jgi:hypothetical protein
MKMIRIFLAMFLLSIVFLGCVKAKQEPIVCIPESERTEVQLQNDRFWNGLNRLSKLQQDCVMAEIEATNQVAICPKIPFAHRSSGKTNIFLEAKDNSKVIAAIKKDQEILFISEANKNWNYITIRNEDKCITGYVKAIYTVKKGAKDTVVSAGPDLLSIIQPAWKIENKLMTINAEGMVSILGAIEEGKIDQVVINGQEEALQGNNTFSHLLFVPSAGAEVRIVASNKGKKVKELIFKVEVGN